MKRMRAAMAAAALAAAGAGAAAEAQQRLRPTEAELYCADLKRLVREAPDFAGMWRAKPAPPSLGFRPGSCRVQEATATLPAAFSCHQHLAPAHLALDLLATQTAGCLPELKRLETRWSREALFEGHGVRIRISESGGPGAKVGRIVGVRVEAVGVATE